MGTPSADDPLGQRPDPASVFDAITTVIDERIAKRLEGRTQPIFNGVPDMDLVRELLVRGWAVFKPSSNA